MIGSPAPALIATADAPALVSISPPVLFFFLGVIATLVRSKLTIPKSVTKLLSLYLLWAIGFRGGVELGASGLSADTLRAVAVAAGACVLVPVWTYFVLRRVVDARNAAALAACYGSVSVVTFLTACAWLDQNQVPFSGHMAAVMALMESPAIVISLMLLGFDGSAGGPAEPVRRPAMGEVLHEALLNGPVLLLLGSIVVGVLTGSKGYAVFKPLCTDAFPGVLAFFLLDLGLVAARRVKGVLGAPRVLIVFAIVGPVFNAALALAGARALNVGAGDAVLLAVLAASASYIAAPAALRLAIPKADPALYTALAIGITFPFNIAVGIPLYAAAVRWWW